jgi:hypothetical protein
MTRGAPAIRHPEAKPTARQMYALAHELAKHAGIAFPSTRGAASELIERLREKSCKQSASIRSGADALPS